MGERKADLDLREWTLDTTGGPNGRCFWRVRHRDREVPAEARPESVTVVPKATYVEVEQAAGRYAIEGNGKGEDHREALCAALGVPAHPIGPNNLTSTLLKRVESLVTRSSPVPGGTLERK